MNKTDLESISPNNIRIKSDFNKLPILFFIQAVKYPLKIWLNFFFRFIFAAVILGLLFWSYSELYSLFLYRGVIDYSFETPPDFIRSQLLYSFDFFIFLIISIFIYFIERYDFKMRQSFKGILAPLKESAIKMGKLIAIYIGLLSLIYGIVHVLNLNNFINENFPLRILLILSFNILIMFFVFSPLILISKNQFSVKDALWVSFNAIRINFFAIILFLIIQAVLICIVLFISGRLLDYIPFSFDIFFAVSVLLYSFMYAILSVLYIEIFTEYES